MIMFFIILCLCFIANFSYSLKYLEENIIGIWKHQKDEIFLIFFNNNKFILRLTSAKKNIEFIGKYNIIDKNIIKINFYQKTHFLSSGGKIKCKPQSIEITFDNNRLILMGIECDKINKDVFFKIIDNSKHI